MVLTKSPIHHFGSGGTVIRHLNWDRNICSAGFILTTFIRPVTISWYEWDNCFVAQADFASKLIISLLFCFPKLHEIKDAYRLRRVLRYSGVGKNLSWMGVVLPYS